ncbi:unnamed protein product [Darwinula stevensoni]|uniref:PRA1 family protein n=1 Tax=Darwinula stevensoni TaxID=69355 RepID=A0A7R8XCS8_9CRUS|nr:unnamed protein product [Darwinula stevensoni]CAG0886075.1 unnamed protein product [Darwinula stevensoni]
MADVKVEVEIAPLRSLDDFLLNSARFQIPNLRDPEKWPKRVVHNLLYYQTNYFVLTVVIFLIIGIMHPQKMLLGMLAAGVAFALFYYISNSQRSLQNFKQNHPIISVIIVFSACYFIVYMMGNVAIFLLGILLPIFLILVHASLRLRNIRNKLSRRMETFGLVKTPMGVILETFGLESEVQKEQS